MAKRQGNKDRMTFNYGHDVAKTRLSTKLKNNGFDIYEIRKAGKLTVLDAGICIVAVFLSFVYVIAFLGNKFANNWDTVIWEKK